jgi:uncharacterized protein YwqG
MLPQMIQEDLLRFIKLYELDEQVAKVMLDQAETSIELTLEEEEDYSRVGNSRIAGCPDLPPSIQWPIDPDGEYWTFIAQINLEELPLSPYEGFPKRGILYFFLGLDEPAYDIDHRIFYYDGDLSALKKTDPPKDREEICEERREFVSHQISFKPVWTLPEKVIDVLSEEVSDMDVIVDNYSDAIWGQHQGWAGDTPLDAYLCRNGLNDILFNHYKTLDRIQQELREAEETGNQNYAQYLVTKVIPQLNEFIANKDKHEAGAANWHVLLSISSIDEVGMCWWDAGYLEVLIDKSDLERLDFSRTYVNLATS